MIKKSLLIAACAFVAYNVLVAFVAHPDLPQTDERKNLTRAETLLYNNTPADRVIIGTSLAARVDAGEKDGYTNMALSGQSPMEGLRILRRTPKVPKYIFIETNMLDRTPNALFSDQLFKPSIYYVKKYLPVFRVGNEPVTYAEYLLHKAVVTIYKPAKASNSSAQGDTYEERKLAREKAAKLTFINSVNHLKDVYVHYSPESLQANISELQDDVAYFESKGSTVIFFEMPVSSYLRNLNKPIAVRSIMKEYFPDTKYSYILPEADKQYTTGDGAHLMPDEAKGYTKYFITQAENSIQR